MNKSTEFSRIEGCQPSIWLFYPGEALPGLATLKPITGQIVIEYKVYLALPILHFNSKEILPGALLNSFFVQLQIAHRIDL